jgi:hypothetical protein
LDGRWKEAVGRGCGGRRDHDGDGERVEQRRRTGVGREEPCCACAF